MHKDTSVRPSARNLLRALAIAAVGTAGCAMAFFGVAEFLVPPERIVPHAYHELLLRNIPSPRIIVDSGSNSRFGIAPAVLEAEFRRPTVVAADHGSVPLEMKVARLERYARQGDVIILPLEWIHYTRSTIPADFKARIGSEFSSYYRSLPVLDRFAFVLKHMSLTDFAQGIRGWVKEIEAQGIRNWIKAPGNQVEKRRFHHTLVAASVRPNGDYKADSLKPAKPRGTACDQYLGIQPDQIADVVYEAAERLARLQQERRATVILTWPSIAGKGCYQAAMPVAKMTSAIKDIFERAGIAVVGTPQDAAFGEEYALDTNYHIDSTAAQVRTARLAQAIRQAGITITPSDIPTIAPLADAALSREEARMHADEVKDLQGLVSGVYKLGTPEFNRHFTLLSGWYPEQPGQVWSRGETSVIAFRPGKANCAMVVGGNYFANQGPSTFVLSNTFIKKDDGQPLSIPGGSAPLYLQMFHPNVASPLKLGLGLDTRSLRFSLNTIAVHCP